MTGERKVHWLGFVDQAYVKFHRPHSCDSSSWMQASRFGSCGFYFGNGVLKPFKRRKLTSNIVNAVAPRVAAYGLDARSSY